VLLRTLPVTHPEQLVLLRWESPHVVTDSLPYPTFAQLRDSSHVFDGMFAFCYLDLATGVDGKPSIAEGQLVSGSFSSVLGVQAIAGRTFTSEEGGGRGGDRVAGIGCRYWRGRCGLDPTGVANPSRSTVCLLPSSASLLRGSMVSAWAMRRTFGYP